MSEQKYFDFLNHLRESGSINMIGAAPFLAEEFDLPLRDARGVLSRWMKTFETEDDK